MQRKTPDAQRRTRKALILIAPHSLTRQASPRDTRLRGLRDLRLTQPPLQRRFVFIRVD